MAAVHESEEASRQTEAVDEQMSIADSVIEARTDDHPVCDTYVEDTQRDHPDDVLCPFCSHRVSKHQRQPEGENVQRLLF